MENLRRIFRYTYKNTSKLLDWDVFFYKYQIMFDHIFIVGLFIGPKWSHTTALKKYAGNYRDLDTQLALG